MAGPDQGSAAFRRALSIAIGPLALVGCIGALLAPLGAVEHIRGLLLQLCITATHVTSDVAAIGLVLLTGGTITVAMISALASATLQWRARRSWITTAGAAQQRVASACRVHGITVPARVFRHSELLACSRGVVTPTIWISESAVEQLAADELVAVLAHEQHHCLRRDPAKRQLLELLARILFAFPVIDAASRTYQRIAEFAADDSSVRVTSARTTASALLRFADAPATPALVQFGAATTIIERVQRLLGTPPAVEPRMSRALLVSALTGVVALACVSVMALIPVM